MSERQSSSLRYHKPGAMYVSGIDQRDGLITTHDADGQRVKQQRVPNDRAGLRGPRRGNR